MTICMQKLCILQPFCEAKNYSMDNIENKNDAREEEEDEKDEDENYLLQALDNL